MFSRHMRILHAHGVTSRNLELFCKVSSSGQSETSQIGANLQKFGAFLQQARQDMLGVGVQLDTLKSKYTGCSSTSEKMELKSDTLFSTLQQFSAVLRQARKLSCDNSSGMQRPRIGRTRL